LTHAATNIHQNLGDCRRRSGRADGVVAEFEVERGRSGD
jgi:hypothetical protein